MENSNGVNKKKMRKLLYIYIAVILVLVFSSRTIYNFSLPKVTIAMAQSDWIIKELEVRGVVEFSETFDIYALSSGWIDEMFINRGDFIDANTIIARYNPTSTTNEQAVASLLTNIERTEHQLTRLNIQRGDIQNNLHTLSGVSPGDVLQHQWAVNDAMLNVENRQTEHIQAQQMATMPQGFFMYINARTDAERDWNRSVTELNQAQAALQELEARGSNFDDFTYMQAIQEATIALERRAIDLQNAESNLADARCISAATFDARNYQNAITAARTTRQRNQLAYEAAHQQLNIAWQRLHTLDINADRTEVAAAHAAINDAQNNVISARLNLDESNTLLEQASDNLQRERNAFNTQDREQRNQDVETAEALVVQAENAVDDATRAYENAMATLDRAELAAIAGWQNEILEAQNRVDNALLALDESAWMASQNLRQAESNLANAYQALERAEATLELAQRETSTQIDDARRAREIELRNINLDIERTLIDLHADQSALAAMTNSDTTNIITNRQGIVMTIDKREGEFISQGERIATIGVDNNRFMVEFSTTVSEAGFIEIGNEASIFRSGSNIGIRAFVYNITPVGDNLNIQLISETDQFNGGEFVRVLFRKQTGIHEMVVPNEAIFIGAMGQHYVWTVQSRQGTLGTEYISVRRSVRIIDSDDFNSAIYMSFMMMNMPVITSYSRELSINGRVSRME
ncbi:MAG: HlyD family efflux transporter periplasmic adaptor subunit [Defluviitaleaceae bacterium]|nr:HlyD family efflux transporter periplasmic adaptor subunit [Defluviitaleaceae bacterium]